MMRWITLLVLVALPVSAQAQSPQCLTTTEAEPVVQIALPGIIRDAGRVCAALPATSLLRRDTGAFIAKYDLAADQAWPRARAALAKVAPPAIAGLLGSDLARPLLTSIVTAQVTGKLQPSDCATVDRMVTLIAPLPAANAAGLVVAALQYAAAKRTPGQNNPAASLPLCTEAAK